MEHTWGSGVPVHFGGIYLGYLASLWLWRRRERLRAEDPAPGPSELSRQAAKALGVGVVIVVVGGALVSLALGEFPGVTWFLVRVLIAVPLLLAVREESRRRGHYGRCGTQLWKEDGMGVCEVCGNEYDKSFEVVTSDGVGRVFDSFECAIHAMAPVCGHCGCRVIGHGVEGGGKMFCCARCAAEAGVGGLRDRL